MCGRFVLSNFTDVKDFHNVLIEPSYNIAPSHSTLIFNQDMNPDFLEWGYSPVWAKKPMNLINAKYESLDIKPSFRNYETCVFVADGWFEWQKNSRGEKNPIFIHADNEIFYFAGIKNTSGAAIVTIDAHQSLANIHHRQPMILDRLEIFHWLSNRQSISSSNLLEKIKSHPVSKYVNSPINNDQRCIFETHMER
jgi:putative SOS response-associated peptidase YedK